MTNLRQSTEFPIRYAVGGLVYFLTPNVAFDIRAGGGLTQDATRFLAGVGFVLRY